jgi:hypothetical protein
MPPDMARTRRWPSSRSNRLRPYSLRPGDAVKTMVVSRSGRLRAAEHLQARHGLKFSSGQPIGQLPMDKMSPPVRWSEVARGARAGLLS